ncbi:N-alpha-acetyltransferase 40 isoform X1 [Enhydra lutris kenyoni]|nr:N-alpha-acetyltransferase 40 isoform X1 [Enhydra lutris kenyoni]
MSAYLLGTCWGPGPTQVLSCALTGSSRWPCFPRISTLSDTEAEKSGDAPELSRLENTCVFPIPASVQQPGLAAPATEDRPVDSGPDSVRFLKGKEESLVGHSPSSQLCFSLLQRKSSKAKEKKQKRLEERAAMDAVCAKVDAANRLGDPLEAFPVFKKYDRNGLNVSIECKRVSGLEPATVAWAFDLTKTNMQTMYEQSEWGWKDREKREEMTDDRAWYLIAWESSSVPVAFSHFRFDVECGDEVLYCYEVQLESKVRRKGLGKFLIQILQLMANSTQMKKVMLTVFKHNHGAYQFFREALQFEIDDSSPSMSGCCGEDCSYEILSRRTKFGDSQHSHAGGHCGGCCH